jgi:hypothetical protein
VEILCIIPSLPKVFFLLLTPSFMLVFDEDMRHKHHAMKIYKGHQAPRILSFGVKWQYGGKPLFQLLYQ